MDRLTAYFIGEMLRIQNEDPERFQQIHDHECPHSYGLPSFKHDHICELSTCEKCWEEAMSGRDRKKKNTLWKMWQRVKKAVKRMKEVFKCSG